MTKDEITRIKKVLCSEIYDKYIMHNHTEQVIEHILFILGIDNLNFISDIERKIIANSAEIQAEAIEE